MSRRYELNMTQGSILKGIIAFVIPLMLSSMLQICFNAADIIVLSRWSGSTSMASVGATSTLTNLIVNLFVGMSIGATVIVSRNYGAGDREGVKRSIHTSLLFSIIVGFITFALGQIFCKPMLILIDTPSGDVLNGAVLYMRIIFAGTPATVVYNYCAAMLRSMGDSKRPLYILALCGAVNVVLNLIFVIFFNMSVAGVALATVISKYLSVVLVLITLKSGTSMCELSLKDLKIHKKELLAVLKIGFPAGLNNVFTSFANTLIQTEVNAFGTAAIAGNTAAVNIENFAVVFKGAFRQATVTAVGQNYGAKNEERIARSVKTALACGVIGCFVLGAGMVLFSRQLLSIYITDSEEAIRFGTIRLILTTAPYFISGIQEITSGYLRGIGYSSLTTTNAFIGMIVFRVLYVLLVYPFFGTFEALYIATPITWVIVSVLNIISLARVKGKAIKKMYEEK